MRSFISLVLFGLLIAFVVSCAPEGDASLRANDSFEDTVSVNRLTADEKAAGWMLLFNGEDLQGWHGLGRDDIPEGHWVVEDGAIKKVAGDQVPMGPDGEPVEGGDLITTDTYENFELRFEWKVSPAGNSGIKYNVSEDMSAANGSHAALGFEYQVIDGEGHPQVQPEDSTYMAGALYDLIPPRGRTLQPVGEWNSARIVLCGQHGEHWLNGSKVVEYELGSPRFDSLLAASKFADVAGFTDRRRGVIALQDHNDAAGYRNIKLKVLQEERCVE